MTRPCFQGPSGVVTTAALPVDIDPALTYAALHTDDGGRTWSQHGICSGQQALDSLARSTDPACLRFEVLR